jgi:acyl-CoA dehydrogenase
VAVDHVAHIGLVPTSEVDIATQLNIAREPRGTVTFREGTRAALTPVRGVPADCVTYFGAMLRSAQMAGAAERLLEQTVQYAGERVQFGRSLSAFQIIQQNIAVLACESAAMSAAASYAFHCADTESPELAIAAAKVRTGVAAGKVASLAHAVHGAIGFTYEHSLHYSSRRLWSWRSEFGSHAWWSGHIGRACIAAGPEQWWPTMTRGSLAIECLE